DQRALRTQWQSSDPVCGRSKLLRGSDTDHIGPVRDAAGTAPLRSTAGQSGPSGTSGAAGGSGAGAVGAGGAGGGWGGGAGGGAGGGGAWGGGRWGRYGTVGGGGGVGGLGVVGGAAGVSGAVRGGSSGASALSEKCTPGGRCVVYERTGSGECIFTDNLQAAPGFRSPRASGVASVLPSPAPGRR